MREVTEISALDDSEKIGAVYTPAKWAEWAVSEFELPQLWAAGARIADPTMGDGAFIKALISTCHKERIYITPGMISRLHGFDIDESACVSFETSMDD